VTLVRFEASRGSTFPRTSHVDQGLHFTRRIRCFVPFCRSLPLCPAARTAVRRGGGQTKDSGHSTAKPPLTIVNINTRPHPTRGAAGVGGQNATRIVGLYRQKNGPFKRWRIDNVRGIGEKNFLKLSRSLTVVTAKAAPGPAVTLEGRPLRAPGRFRSEHGLGADGYSLWSVFVLGMVVTISAAAVPQSLAGIGRFTRDGSGRATISARAAGPHGSDHAIGGSRDAVIETPGLTYAVFLGRQSQWSAVRTSRAASMPHRRAGAAVHQFTGVDFGAFQSSRRSTKLRTR